MIDLSFFLFFLFLYMYLVMLFTRMDEWRSFLLALCHCAYTFTYSYLVIYMQCNFVHSLFGRYISHARRHLLLTRVIESDILFLIHL